MINHENGVRNKNNEIDNKMIIRDGSNIIPIFSIERRGFVFPYRIEDRNATPLQYGMQTMVPSDFYVCSFNNYCEPPVSATGFRRG